MSEAPVNPDIDGKGLVSSIGKQVDTCRHLRTDAGESPEVVLPLLRSHRSQVLQGCFVGKFCEQVKEPAGAVPEPQAFYS
jgi:hypothetical protein